MRRILTGRQVPGDRQRPCGSAGLAHYKELTRLSPGCSAAEEGRLAALATVGALIRVTPLDGSKTGPARNTHGISSGLRPGPGVPRRSSGPDTPGAAPRRLAEQLGIALPELPRGHLVERRNLLPAAPTKWRNWLPGG